ncbi:tic22-like family protein [Wolffia australiana]
MVATPRSSSSSEMEQSAVAIPFLDGAGQLMQSLTANLLSTFQIPLNCKLNRGASRAELRPISPNLAVVSQLSSENLSASSAIRSLSTSVRVDGLGLGSKTGGPAFVGQVFSMCDPSGTGLMAVTTHFGIPFLSKRTPEWVKKMLGGFKSKDKEGPVFRFFMDLGDAVSYVKKLNIPTGMVGACRLDVAYEHFKEKPHAFQFVPNGKQVKEANKLLRDARQRGGKRKVGGVPVFTAQNLNIAIATSSGIRWYTPYFFDKKLLDSILEASVDQHFHGLIRQRQSQRRKDVLDGGAAGDVFDDGGESLFDPPEVQELLEELGHPGIPMSVVSKAAEIQILDAVDKVLLGNRWLRKAAGIQPKFPYLVDSFEERTAASLQRVAESSRTASDLQSGGVVRSDLQVSSTECSTPDYPESGGFRFPAGNWEKKPTREEGSTVQNPSHHEKSEPGQNPLLPKITMVGISTGEGGRVSKASLKKTMEELTRELEQSSQGAAALCEDKDPLFVANVGDYSTITRMSSAR